MKSEPEPKYELSGGRACRIQQRIPGRCRAARHKPLMKFIERRISRSDHERGDGPANLPSSMLLADRAQQKKTKREIFGEVGCLANQELQAFKDFGTCMRKQPVKRWKH